MNPQLLRDVLDGVEDDDFIERAVKELLGR
jgi:hypothetical protein